MKAPEAVGKLQRMEKQMKPAATRMAAAANGVAVLSPIDDVIALTGLSRSRYYELAKDYPELKPIPIWGTTRTGVVLADALRVIEREIHSVRNSRES